MRISTQNQTDLETNKDYFIYADEDWDHTHKVEKYNLFSMCDEPVERISRGGAFKVPEVQCCARQTVKKTPWLK